MSNGFTEELRQLADPIWNAQHQHPFVRAIGEGTLDLEKLGFWVRQDYVFLVEYCRLLGIAAARAPDLETMVRFAELLSATLKTEMDLHRSYAREFGITAEELEEEQPAPVTRAYCDFLLRTAAMGSFGELCSALLPCMWGFSEIGRRLAEGGIPEEPHCAAWIRMYSDPEFEALAQWFRGLVDRLADRQPEEELSRMRKAFLTSSRYELMFWEMAYRLEGWGEV